MRQARLTDDEPPMPREIEARERILHDDCSRRLSLLWPGVIQHCRGRTAEGSVLIGLGAAELGVGIGAAVDQGTDSPAAGIPLLAFADLFTASAIDAVLENQRAARYRFVPQESLTEMAASPFSGEVLSKPYVWAGIIGTFAAGILVSRIVDGPYDTTNFGKRPVLFGQEMNSAVGYPLAGAIGIALFEHVAVAEESVFRGLVQSGFSRSSGETKGWIYGSLVFGLAHSTNVFFIDESQRATYLLVGVPFITLLGSYLGLAYRWSGYSLGPSVAIHFWYDFLIEAWGFILDPKHSPLAVTWSMPF
jgi:membrane protease YdiL (CAAX protease family)